MWDTGLSGRFGSRVLGERSSENLVSLTANRDIE